MPPSRCPVSLAVLFLLLAGCTPTRGAPGADGGTRPGTCARFGQTCELSPGKLGTCVEKTACTGSDCLICQSQH